MAKALALLLLAALPASAAADEQFQAEIVAAIDGAARRLDAHEKKEGDASKCDAAKAGKDMQAAAMAMASAGKDCGKIEKAHRDMKAAINDNGCEEQFKDNTSYQQGMKNLETAMDQHGCNSSSSDAVQGALFSIPLLAAMALFVH